jgi:hypothetical protein
MTVLIVFLIVVFIGYAIFREKNPYIKLHKRKWQNERDYESYLKWLDKSGGDLPLPENKFDGDKEVLKEIDKYINK